MPITTLRIQRHSPGYVVKRRRNLSRLSDMQNQEFSGKMKCSTIHEIRL